MGRDHTEWGGESGGREGEKEEEEKKKRKLICLFPEFSPFNKPATCV